MPDPVTVGAALAATLGGGVALSKLLEVAKSGIGAVARPWLMVRDAKAKAEVDKILDDAAIALEEKRKALAAPAPAEPATPIAPLAADAAPIEVVWEDLPTLSARADERLTYQEEKRQLNIERVVLEAADELRDAQGVSNEPVNDDWTAAFFTNVQDVSDEQMRRVWAKILAGEVAHPGSFSLRTLALLKTTSREDAALFARVAQMASRAGAVVETPHSNKVMSYAESLDLMNAGLLTRQSLMSFKFPYVELPEKKQRFLLDFDTIALTAEHEKLEWHEELSFSASVLTRSGRELARLLVTEPDAEQLRAVAKVLHERGFATQYHRILQRLDERNLRLSEPLPDLP